LLLLLSIFGNLRVCGNYNRRVGLRICGSINRGIRLRVCGNINRGAESRENTAFGRGSLLFCSFLLYWSRINLSFGACSG
jgi:hypothetical protein